LPREVERELLLKLKGEHYAKWPDQSLPALHGKTARQAVIDLLRTMENGEERLRKEGRPAYDFSRLRKELGIAEE
jgi:hypothetical protein